MSFVFILEAASRERETTRHFCLAVDIFWGTSSGSPRVGSRGTNPARHSCPDVTVYGMDGCDDSPIEVQQMLSSGHEMSVENPGKIRG